MRKRFRAVAVLTVALGMVSAVAGCGDDDTDGGTGPTSPLDPITVQQLIERSADTPIAVQGFLYGDEGATRLCFAILESFPPQCGEPAVELVGIDLATIEGTTTASGITWKEHVVLELKAEADGRFTVIDVDASPSST